MSEVRKNFAPERENIWNEGEYNYAAAYGFVPNLRFYLHEEENDANEGSGKKARPFMLVVPGGGYCMVVPPEGEIVAKCFFEKGMNCAVLTYTTDITMCVPLKKQPMMDASRALRYIRKNAARLGADPEKITICGFSAGAHVCGSLGVHYKDITDPDPELDKFPNRPDAMILSYPVITSGEFTHTYSMWALIGKDAPKEEYEYFSLEKHVTPDTPPTFLWQTVTDDLVPVENSALFATSLRKEGVTFAYYAFPAGWHGLCICNDAFRKGEFGEPYSMEQVERAVAAVREGKGVNVPDSRRAELMEQFKEPMQDPEGFPPVQEFKDVEKWPDLAEAFLLRIFA